MRMIHISITWTGSSKEGLVDCPLHSQLHRWRIHLTASPSDILRPSGNVATANPIVGEPSVTVAGGNHSVGGPAVALTPSIVTRPPSRNVSFVQPSCISTFGFLPCTLYSRPFTSTTSHVLGFVQSKALTVPVMVIGLST